MNDPAPTRVSAVDELEQRVDHLEADVAELVRIGASDKRVDALEERLERALARIRELERSA
ncbi:MAG TPA: hypothetical protein VH395_08990 [Jatrophihabitantaceae bacterium]|jgi:hypothetical protein